MLIIKAIYFYKHLLLLLCRYASALERNPEDYDAMYNWALVLQVWFHYFKYCLGTMCSNLEYLAVHLNNLLTKCCFGEILFVLESFPVKDGIIYMSFHNFNSIM